MRRRDFLSGAAIPLAMPYVAQASFNRPVLVQRTLDAPPRCVDLGNGKWTGFEIEFSRLLCDKVGATLQPIREYLVWSRALRMIETGDLHLLPNVTWRAERTKIMDFIGPCAMVEIYILVRKENADTRFETLDDFLVEGRLFEHVTGSAVEPSFDKRMLEDPDFSSHFIGTVSSSSMQETGHLQALGNRVARGRVFGAIIDWYAYNAIKNMSPADLTFDPDDLVRIKPSLFKVAKNYLSASLHVDHSLRQKLRTAYLETRQNGTFDQLWNEWYKGREIPEVE